MEIERKNQKRITIRSHYDEKAVVFFRSIPKYYYDFLKKEWSFPIEALEPIREFLDFNDGVFIILDSRTPTEIKVLSSGRLQIHFAYHIADFERMRALKNFEYNNATRIMQCDSSELPKVKKYLIDEDMNFHVTNPDDASGQDEVKESNDQSALEQPHVANPGEPKLKKFKNKRALTRTEGTEVFAASYLSPLMLDDEVVKDFEEKAQEDSESD
jgi:hypothetical protein